MKFYKLFYLIIIGIALTSCEDNNVELAQESAVVQFTEKSYLRGELFTYTTNEELHDNSARALAELAEEDDLEIQAATDFDKIINKIKVSGGKGLLVEKLYKYWQGFNCPFLNP